MRHNKERGRTTVTRWPRGGVGLVVGIFLLIGGCAASLPSRYVVEDDLGAWSYRRYQRILDIEFPLPGTSAEGHTATYIRRRKGTIPVATAFVTLYKNPASLAAHVRDRVQSLVTYDAKIKRMRGQNVWWLDGGDQKWAMWISGPFLVKLGAPRGADELPDVLLATYLARYSSDLNKHGRARKGAASAGELEDRDASLADPELPKHLRENAPR